LLQPGERPKFAKEKKCDNALKLESNLKIQRKKNGWSLPKGGRH